MSDCRGCGNWKSDCTCYAKKKANDQPMPTSGRQLVPDVAIEKFIETHKQQDEGGQKKYGTRLHTFNGRNSYTDARQELVDANQYLTQAELEFKEIATKLFEAVILLQRALPYVPRGMPNYIRLDIEEFLSKNN